MAGDILRMSGVYEIVNARNGKRYVGSAAKFSARFGVHRNGLREGKHHNRHLQAAWNKHGEDAFSFRPLLVCSVKDAVFYEQSVMDALRPEYNIAKVAGSCLGVRHTPEVRAKRSAMNMGNNFNLGKKASEETRALMSAQRKGRDKGKRRSPESVAKTAAAHLGMKRSDETRARIAAKAIGRKCKPRSAEHRAKISAAHKGKPKSPYQIAALQAGRAAFVLTDDHKAAISRRLADGYASGKRSREKSAIHRNRIAETVSKLTADQVREVRRLRANGVTGRTLAEQFSISASSITEIVKGRTYRWVPLD